MPAPSEGLPASLNLREVLPGRLWRSAAPIQWGPQRWQGFVAATRLHLVVDLRMTHEAAKQGTPTMPEGCTVLALPLFESPLPDWEHPADTSPGATAERYLAMAEQGRPALRTLVESLRSAKGPVLVHCAAGRDRTGIAVACVLALEGFPDQAIVDDYALSDLAAFDGGRADPQTMARFLELVRARYGSVQDFLALSR